MVNKIPQNGNNISNTQPKILNTGTSNKNVTILQHSIESSNVDITSIIQTEVFLNHHYNISFYCIRNNFPYQFHCPLKISKLLLDRNEGAVELYISNGLYFKIQADSDALEILSNVQNSLQGFQSQQNVVFTLKYWQIQIRLIVLNESFQQGKIKQAIASMQQTNNQNPPLQYQNFNQTMGNMSININLVQSTTQYQMYQLNKLILYIDENNYEQFLGWSQNESILFNYQVNQKLSNQYMSLKQEIDNEKNLFRNKIKMVQAILGENINIDKLLSQQKQENQQYKRLRETFQTIKNIDNVLIQQEKKLQLKSNQLKQKRAEKHKTHYQNAKVFAKGKNQIASLLKQIQQLKYKCDCVSANKIDYEFRRNFQPSKRIKEILILQQNRCKSIIKNVSSFQKDSKKQNQKQQELLIKNRTIQSLHKCVKKQMQNYQNLLKSKVKTYQKQIKNKNQLKVKDRISEQTYKYEAILYHMSKFYQKNNQILCQIKSQLQKCTKYSTSYYNDQKSINFSPKYIASPIKRINNIEWRQQYIVLRQILQNNPRQYSFAKNNGVSISVTNKIQSCASIQKNSSPQQQRQKQKQREKEKQKDKNLQRQNQKTNNKAQSASIFGKNRQNKEKLKTVFHGQLKKKSKIQFGLREQKSTIKFND